MQVTFETHWDREEEIKKELEKVFGAYNIQFHDDD